MQEKDSEHEMHMVHTITDIMTEMVNDLTEFIDININT